MHSQSKYFVGRGDRGQVPPTPGGPKLPSFFPKTSVVDPVPGRAVPVWGLKSDQTPGSLCAPPFAGNNRDYG